MDTMSVQARRKPGRMTLVIGIALAALGLLSFNAWATFTAQVIPTHASDTGDMEFTLGSGDKDTSISTAATDIVPGDTITRTVKITVANEGATMTGVTLTTSGSGSPARFVTTATTGLQLWIERCDVAYTVAPAYPGIPTSVTCSGTPTDVLGTTGSPVDFVQERDRDHDGPDGHGRELPQGADDIALGGTRLDGEPELDALLPVRRCAAGRDEQVAAWRGRAVFSEAPAGHLPVRMALRRGWPDAP